MRNTTLVWIFLSLTFPALVMAQDPEKRPGKELKKRAEKVSIKADHVTIGPKGETFFKGHVRILIGDYLIRCETLERGPKSRVFTVPGLLKCYQRTGKKELVGQAKSGRFDVDSQRLVLNELKTLGIFGEGYAEKADLSIEDQSGSFLKARFKHEKWGKLRADRCVVVKGRKMILSGNVFFEHKQGQLRCKRLTLIEDAQLGRAKLHYKSGDVTGFVYSKQ